MIISSDTDAYTELLIKLSPKGDIWPTITSSTWYNFLGGIATELARADANTVLLLNECMPDTTSQLLPNWESTLGLPDATTDPNGSTAEIRNSVLAKLRATGGQSAAYYKSVFAAYGYPDTYFLNLQPAAPFAAGIGFAGGFINDDTAYPNVFIVSTYDFVTYKPGFEALMAELQPAQTFALFAYI